MAQYYYDKFTAIPNSIPIYGYTVKWRNATTGGAGSVTGYSSYEVNQSTGIITSTGTLMTLTTSTGPFGTVYTTNNTKQVRSYTINNGSTYILDNIGDSEYGQTGTSTSYSKGSLIQANILAEDGTYPANGRHTDGYWYVKKGVANTAPTVTLTSPTNNQTLYENDTLNIAGTAYDVDKDQSVTVYYQINSEQRKVLATNLSQTQISLTKQLTFKGGKLFDGDTAITGTLAEGVAHTLKVWAVDSENASSTAVERAFYVVPNRAPLLTINPPNPSGIIDTDSFVVEGTFEDLDKNETTVSYRINGGNALQIASGIGGAFDFNVSLGALKVGENAITVEAVDSYGAKTSQTVKLRKNKVAVPIHKSTARYKIMPPTGSASEILIWIQRDAELTLNASASMTLAGEQESFKQMALNVTENLQNGQVEDEFYIAADEAKDSIILQLELEQTNPSAGNAITLIMGVL